MFRQLFRLCAPFGMAAACLLLIPASARAQGRLDEGLPIYRPVEGVSGTIKSAGSDTLNNLMTLWAEGFRKLYPNVQIEIEGQGSSTAPPALIEGTATFGPMSRPMKGKELEEFELKHGYRPTALKTSIDMLAVYVNKDNPVEGLTFAQLDAIFSKDRKLGFDTDLVNWGELGLSGRWATLPISLYGRNAASGTYGFFKEHVLGKGDYKDSVKEQPGSSSVVQGVASDRGGIGYSGIGYKTADVRAVPLAPDEESGFVPAMPEHAYTGDYPLARFLLIYVNHKPNTELDPLPREFIRYIFSRQGQEDVVKDGYFPVTASMAEEALRSVGIGLDPSERTGVVMKNGLTAARDEAGRDRWAKSASHGHALHTMAAAKGLIPRGSRYQGLFVESAVHGSASQPMKAAQGMIPRGSRYQGLCIKTAEQGYDRGIGMIAK
jgi:phosphate transport system substrate-binding protein